MAARKSRRKRSSDCIAFSILHTIYYEYTHTHHYSYPITVAETFFVIPETESTTY